MIKETHKSLLILAAVYSIAIFTLVIVSFNTYNEAKSLIREQFNEKRLFLVKQSVHSIEENIQVAVHEIKLLSEVPALKEMNLEKSREYIRQTFKFVKNFFVTDISLQNSSGFTQFSINDLQNMENFQLPQEI
ncbi:MAG: hypothetical protein ACE5GL_05175, partial [Calditrichia bacterium]